MSTRRAAMARGGTDWAELARLAAIRDAGADHEDPLRELLAFILAGTRYAIPVERARGIVRRCPITPMPGVPPVVLGVLALRGEMLQVVDLRLRLGLEAAAPARTNRIIIVQGHSGQAAGLLVDAVTEVLRVSDASIGAPASTAQDPVVALCLHGERFVSLLDVDGVLDLGYAG